MKLNKKYYICCISKCQALFFNFCHFLLSSSLYSTNSNLWDSIGYRLSFTKRFWIAFYFLFFLLFLCSPVTTVAPAPNEPAISTAYKETFDISPVFGDFPGLAEPNCPDCSGCPDCSCYSDCSTLITTSMSFTTR